MDYKQKIKEMLTSMKQCQRRESLVKAEEVMAIIGRIPLFIFWAFLMAGYYITLFIYEAFSAPIQYLEKWQKTSKQDVRPAAECVIYLVSMPLIFFLRVFMALTSVYFFLLWFSIMLCSYLITAGEMKWRPYITADDYEERTWTLENRISGNGNDSSLVAVIAFVVFIVGFIGLLCENFTLWGVCLLIYIAVIALICCFKKKVKRIDMLQ